MNKKYFYRLFFGLTMVCNCSSFAQSGSSPMSENDKVAPYTPDSVRAFRVRDKYQTTMQYSSYKHVGSGSIGNSIENGKYRNGIGNFKYSFEVNQSEKYGYGVAASIVNTEFIAEKFVASVYTPEFWFIFYFPAGNTDYYDRVSIKENGSAISPYFFYNAVRYEPERNQPFEISFLSGLTVCYVDELMSLEGYHTSNSSGSINIDAGNTKEYRFKRTALDAFVNARLLVHTGKHFSLILIA